MIFYLVRDTRGKTYRLSEEKVIAMLRAGKMPADMPLVCEDGGRALHAGDLLPGFVPAAPGTADAPSDGTVKEMDPFAGMNFTRIEASGHIPAKPRPRIRTGVLVAAALVLAAAGGGAWFLLPAFPGKERKSAVWDAVGGDEGASAPAPRAAAAPLAEAQAALATPRKAEDNFKVLGEVNDLKIIGWIDAPAPVREPWLLELTKGDVSKAKADLVADISAALAKHGDDAAALRFAATDPRMRLLMMRHELVRLVGTGCLAEIRQRPEGALFLGQLFGSPEWLEDCLVTGPFGSRSKNANELHFLATLFRYDKRSTLPLYRKLAVAYARSQPGDWQDGADQFSLLDAYQANLKNHQEGRLHASFDRLESWEMMMVTSCDDGGGRIGDSRHQRFLAYDRHCPQGAYDGACWEIPWVDDNQFGDSCQADPYYAMWRNQYVRGAPSIKKVWGVCGTLSTFGAFNARAHGIPSFPVGQPGHCAYMLRYDDENWTTPYSVDWPTGASSFFGSGDESIVRLMQAAYSNKNRAALLLAHQHLWQREFLLAKDRLELQPGSLKLYQGGGQATCKVFESLPPWKESPSGDSDLLGALQGQEGWRGATLDSLFALGQASDIHFSIQSDDGGRLYVDGQLRIDNDGPHGADLKSADLKLDAGPHKIRLEYFDQGGGSFWEFKMERGDPQVDPRAGIALGLALEQCPLHLNAWRLRAEQLRKEKADPARWLKFADAFTCAMREYHHPAWVFLQEEVFPQLASLDAAQKLAFLSAMHRNIKVDARDSAGGWLPEHLDRQADFLADKPSGVALFDALLSAYAGSKGDIARVLSWGNRRLMADPATAEPYLASLAGFLSSQSGPDTVDPAVALGELLVHAETTGNAALFKSVNQLAPGILKGGDPYAARYFSKETAETFPKVRAFPGKVLSADGVLMPSSTYEIPNVLTHASALAGDGYGGMIHTRDEERCFVDLKLPGKAKFSGVVVVNRYDSNGERNVPLKVSVSSDGKTWTEVFASKENLPAWEIDLAGRNVEAQYLRVERAEKRNEPMNLRALRVYGTPLY